MLENYTNIYYTVCITNDYQSSRVMEKLFDRKVKIVTN